jgi:NAD(P)-dependent dehydrogenase (short-subunit alcohol dehydrogenase family)
VCEPEDIAAVVRFLVSDRCTLVTGQRIAVDGGGFGR